MTLEIGGNLLIACIVASLCALFAWVSPRRSDSKTTNNVVVASNATNLDTNTHFTGPVPQAMLNAMGTPSTLLREDVKS